MLGASPQHSGQKTHFCCMLILKKKTHLTPEQRYTIEAMVRMEKKQVDIAMLIDKDKSVISREIKRNSPRNGQYTAKYAQMVCNERKERFKRNRKFTKEVQKLIENYLTKEQWSPKQIIGTAKREGLAMVSHERIYQHLREDKANGGNLYKNLRHLLKHRKRPLSGKHISIKNRVSIDLRPSIVNEKGRFGDWEIDTIVGKENKGAIVTITERTTGFLLMEKLKKGKNTKSLAATVYNLLIPYKKHVLTITSDNGTEFAEHQVIAKKLNTDFYFAHPYSSWERGLNEYTNKLIRQYIPKKQSFENYNNQYIKEIQFKLNQRPREKLNFYSPKEVFFASLNNKVALAS
jgi:transposase, IS30 family